MPIQHVLVWLLTSSIHTSPQTLACVCVCVCVCVCDLYIHGVCIIYPPHHRGNKKSSSKSVSKDSPEQSKNISHSSLAHPEGLEQ